jgi:type III pantothenate kinase
VSRATLDVGNSSIGLAVWRDARPGVVERLATPAEAATRLLAVEWQSCAAISVAPARLADLRERLGSRAQGVRVLRDPPEGLGVPALLSSAGADRIANVLGLEHGPAIAVDAGTAVTVDLLDASGGYLGGFIAPGPAAAARGLASTTASLPVVPGLPVQLQPGTATLAAISSGVWGMAVGGIDRLVDAALGALGGGPARIVATGGWGEAWMKDSRHRDLRWQPDLVHRGIARWAGWS